MNRFLTDQTKWQSITDAFGGDEWQQVLALETGERPGYILRTYGVALKEKASSKYVWHFAMCDSNDKLLYWLFFCTNNIRGLEEMKRAMHKVDPTGGFRFSDKDDPSQLGLFENYNDQILADDLTTTLKGKLLTVFEVKEYVLTETPAYKYKSALKLLEMNEVLKVSTPPPGRRKGTFPDKYMHQMQVEFLS